MISLLGLNDLIERLFAIMQKARSALSNNSPERKILMPSITYVLDTTGTLAANKIPNEAQALSSNTSARQYFIVPECAPFFNNSLKINYRSLDNQIRPFVEGVDFNICFEFASASLACKKKISGGILLTDPTLNGLLVMEYQTIGGGWINPTAVTMETVGDAAINPRKATWEQVANLSEIFPPSIHQDDVNDLGGMEQLLAAIEALTLGVANSQNTQAELPLQLFQTKMQAGLGNVDNFKTASQAEAIAGVSNSRFMTPLGVSQKLQAELTNFLTVFMPNFRSDKQPSSGSFNSGNYVSNTKPTRLIWQSSTPTGKFNGMTYILKGWVRITTGNAHVLGVDWEEDRVIVKD